MFEALKNIDHELFATINHCHAAAWDGTIIFISNKSWYIVMALLAAASVYKFKQNFWIAFISIAMAWGLADLVSTRVFKNNVQRYRPCHNARHKDAHIPTGCGGKYGFVSSHAANSAALATVVMVLFGTTYGSLAFLWAIIVCYTRIYLGRHYPADLVCGMLVGILCGLLVNTLVLNKLKKKFIDHASNT